MRKKTQDPLKVLKKVERRRVHVGWAFIFYGAVAAAVIAVVLFQVLVVMKHHK